MANSAYYAELVQNISVIKSNLFRFSAHRYSVPMNILKHKSAILLIYGEFEFYSEKIAKASLHAKAYLETNPVEIEKFISKLAYYSFLHPYDGGNNTVSQRASKIVDRYEHMLKENHGISRKNILKMFFPLGIEESDLEEAWLTTIDNFAKIRGAIAHNSIGITTNIAYDYISQTIESIILPKFKLIDEKMVQWYGIP